MSNETSASNSSAAAGVMPHSVDEGIAIIEEENEEGLHRFSLTCDCSLWLCSIGGLYESDYHETALEALSIAIKRMRAGEA